MNNMEKIKKAETKRAAASYATYKKMKGGKGDSDPVDNLV